MPGDRVSASCLSECRPCQIPGPARARERIAPETFMSALLLLLLRLLLPVFLVLLVLVLLMLLPGREVSGKAGGGQVCADLHGELSTAVELAESKGEVLLAHEASRKREREWLDRGSATQPKKRARAAWRPVKRYRVGAWRNLLSLDRQLRGLSLQGLAQFQHQPDRPWHSWPILTVAWDQDSCNVASAHFMLYKAGLCADIVWDPAHGAWNSVKMMATESGQMGFLLALLCTWNLPHGPWADDARSSQILELLQELSSGPLEHIPPLLAARLGEIADELGTGEQLSGDSLPEVWESFRKDSPFRRKGSKVCLNRFLVFSSIPSLIVLRIWPFSRSVSVLLVLALPFLLQRVPGDVPRHREKQFVVSAAGGE